MESVESGGVSAKAFRRWLDEGAFTSEQLKKLRTIAKEEGAETSTKELGSDAAVEKEEVVCASLRSTQSLLLSSSSEGAKGKAHHTKTAITQDDLDPGAPARSALTHSLGSQPAMALPTATLVALVMCLAFSFDFCTPLPRSNRMPQVRK